jgi:carbamoyl-phosphate synthase small subunit
LNLHPEDSEKALSLVLHDGSIYQGYSFGAPGIEGHGEVVFNTSMSGYQEMLTDPSYTGQILVPTYPIQGNYGINERDVESDSIKVSGLVVREHCEFPSNRYSTSTLDQYLKDAAIPGLYGIDTRALTRKIRNSGVMMGLITDRESPEEALALLRSLPSYEDWDLVKNISTKVVYSWSESQGKSITPDRPNIVILDEGVKYNILRLLDKRGANVIIVPSSTSLKDIMELKPDGILLSPGPGNPKYLDDVVETTKGLLGQVPILGICLGHQVVARALGAETYKLKFGHRGGNHPVKDLGTNTVRMTAQNHGYAVNPDTLPEGLSASQINLNDDTIEGLTHDTIPLLTIQYHSEASPGPLENEYIFDRFLSLIDNDT